VAIQMVINPPKTWLLHFYNNKTMIILKRSPSTQHQRFTFDK